MSPDDIPLLFHTSCRVRREELRNFLGHLTRRVARGRTIACLIADDAEIRRLNRRYLQSGNSNIAWLIATRTLSWMISIATILCHSS